MRRGVTPLDDVQPVVAVVVDGVTYFSASDVARGAGVARQTLWRWRSEGKVPLGRAYRDRRVVFTSAEAATIREYAQRIEPLTATSVQKSYAVTMQEADDAKR